METGYTETYSFENYSSVNDSLSNKSLKSFKTKPVNAFTAELNITLYSIIFVLSFIGNVLVILTLFREKKMRTITNLFLLNLAVSDMMLSMLCMPFSLVATTLLRNFIFGEAMCIIIRYFQAVSVGVSCYTLVAISLERYYAICQPLKSRRWQTLSHARRMLVGIWVFVLLLMSPIAAFHRLISIKTGVHACREIWPEVLVEYKIDLAYNVVLSVILLLVPLLLMSGFYGVMGKKLWISSRHCTVTETTANGDKLPRKKSKNKFSSSQNASLLSKGAHHAARDLSNRKRVIRMLVVVVLQYFICWTPIYVLNTWLAFDFMGVLRYISPTVKSLVLLLAYTSSFIHPITYCFMNRQFRDGIKRQFCRSGDRSSTTVSYGNSDSGVNIRLGSRA